jgi:hypothetical protein
MAFRAHIIAFDRLQPELVGDLFCPWQAMERFIRRVVRCMHPLLDFRLMALRALIGANYLGRIGHQRSTCGLHSECRKYSNQSCNHSANAKEDLTRTRKGAKKRSIAPCAASHLRKVFHSYVFLRVFAPLRETKTSDLSVQYECGSRYADAGKAVPSRNRNSGLLDRGNCAFANCNHALAAASGAASRGHRHAGGLAELEQR